MINKVTLVGRLKKDAEIFTSAEGQPFASLSVDTWHSWMDRDSGKRKTKHEIHSVLTFRKDLIGYIERNGHQGSHVYLEGSLGSVKQEVEGSPVPVKIAAVLVHRDGTVRFLEKALDLASSDTNIQGNSTDSSSASVVDLPSVSRLGS